MKGSCCARLDRIQLISWEMPDRKPPEALCGFRVAADHFVRPQTNITTYRRCRRYESSASNAAIFWQYQRRRSWLAPWKVTLVADDRTGLTPREVACVLTHCRFPRFLTIEMALDFTSSSGVSARFVQAHGLFGKSRRNFLGDCLRYGSRKSAKLVRFYAKRKLGALRLEVELHSRLLHSVTGLQDLRGLPKTIYPRHLLFVRINWQRLEKYLLRRFGCKGKQLLANCARHATSLHEVRRYLRRKGVLNIHRFFSPLVVNKEIDRALHRWALSFRAEPD